MESAFLRGLSEYCKGYKKVLVYGAGGVAANLLYLLEPYLYKKDVGIAVSDKSKNEPFFGGYPVREISEFGSVCDEVYIIIAVMPKQASQIEKHLKKLGFCNYFIVSGLIEQMYEEIWQFPVRRNKIVFANGSGWGFGGNPKYIAQALMETGEALELVWVAKDVNIELPEGIRAVRYGSYEHYFELGTAGIWIDNQHKSLFTRKRDGQLYMQTWHGGGPLKKIEFDAEGLPDSYLELCEMNSKLEDIMVSPTKFNSGLYRRAFHYNGEIMECGYPRNDIFWRSNSCRQRIEKIYGIKPEEGIVLFAPTFRETDVKSEEQLELTAMKKALEHRFGKKYRILVRRHPSDKESETKYDPYEDWIDVTEYDDTQELLAASDVLITDYSSIMWDFSLQKKPVFLFHPNLQSYKKERGYYLAFEEMPYIEAFSNADLCRKIAEFDEGVYQEEMESFLKEYGSFDRGTAASAVTERLLKIMKGQESEPRIV